MSEYTAEKNFINRKLLTLKQEWDVLPARSELISAPLAEPEAKNIVNTLKDALGKKKGVLVVFHKMVSTVTSKLRGGTRVIISIPLLREYFAGEIEVDWGGGGRGLNPLQTTPRPPGGRGV